MTPLAAGLAVLACLLASAACAGTETGLYSVSRLRVESDAFHGRGSARIVRGLLRDDAGVLIALLLCSNLAQELAAYAGADVLAPLPIPDGAREVVLALLSAPLFFFFGELLPKDLFRRRPHHLLGLTAAPLALLKLLLTPIVVPIRACVEALARFLSLDVHELSRVQGREAVLELLRERGSETPPRTESLARNALELRSLRVERVMVPWRRVQLLDLRLGDARALEELRRVAFTRLPVLDTRGKLAGYVHQLEALAAGPGLDPRTVLRPLPFLEPSTRLDRALERLRLTGQRMAVVGTQARPVGIVTLKDLLEEISGELHRW